MSFPPSRTLLDALRQRFPDSSNSTLRTMLQRDRVRVNGVAERDSKRLVTPADRIEIGAAAGSLDPRVTILHEDPDLIVIDKAAGLLTIATEKGAGATEEAEETAETLLNTYRSAGRGKRRVHVVHRLDRGCSGVLVFAKNQYVRRMLQARFAAHDIERVYVAIVHGQLANPTGTFRSHLKEERDRRIGSTDDASEGKEAITHYRTVRAGPRYSMLEVTLETGRRNQIRVHLAEAGHPIVGDTVYGKGRVDPLQRLGLHARTLGFVHQGTGKRVTFTVAIPQAFTDLDL